MLPAVLLAMQVVSARGTPPVLEFPTPGLDDPAAYEGYTARLYRDSRGNSVEIYIEGKTGRVVHLWADGLNESIGFTVRPVGAVRAAEPRRDGPDRRPLARRGGAGRAGGALAGRVATVRPLGGGTQAISLSVEIATDGPPLSPLDRRQIFDDRFRRFADSAKSPRIEREIRGFELLSSKEKLLAALPTYATYFGRDMLLTALLMEPVWSDTMAEFVIGAALAKLAPTGEVSHEEALGGQAIRENVAEFLRTGDRTLLRNLPATRENYWMVDDDFQLPVVAGRYFANAKVPDARKRAFVRRWDTALRKNLAYAWTQAALYARDPVATNLVSFKRDPDGYCHPGSWRDSRVGYAGGCFPFDVNVVWVPAALRAIGTIDSAFRALGEPGIDNAPDIARAAETWRGTARHFMVALAPADVETRVRAKLASLPAAERAHWESVLTRSGFPADTLRFPAVSLDSAGQQIPVMSTDPAMWLLLDRQDDAHEAGLLGPCAR